LRRTKSRARILLPFRPILRLSAMGGIAMRLHRLLFGLALGGVLLFCGPKAVRAQEGGEAGVGDAEATLGEATLVTRPITPPVAPHRIAPVEALLLAGQYDKALAEAQSLYDGANEAGMRTEAQRLIADALRKKGDWKGTLVAYMKVSTGYEKTSDDYLKYTTIAEILRMSPTGTYRPVVQSDGGGDESPPTLADEAHLAAAIHHQVELMAKKMIAQADARMKRATMPREVLMVFLELMDGLRQPRALCPDLAFEDEHNTAHLAGARLQDIADRTMAHLQAKAAKIRVKRDKPWSYTNIEKDEINKCNALLKDCADVEAQFQTAVGKVGGADKWEEGEELCRLSSDRADRYNQLAEEFFIRPYSVDILR